MQISWPASHALLGIAPQEQPPDHYRLLGLGRLELNADVVVYAAERQSDHLKRYFSGEHGASAIALHDAVSAARDCLLDHDSHQIYAGRLQGFDPDADDLDAKSAWRAFADEFDEAWSQSQALGFDAQHHWLGISRHQRPASNCRLLGLHEGERNADVIRCAAERQISFVRKFASGDKSADANTLLQQLSRARSTLLRTASSSVPDRGAVPESTDPLEEPVEILSEISDPEVDLFADLPASDPTWVTADIIDEPVPDAYKAPAEAAVVEDSQAVLVRQRSRKGRARFTLRAMAFALLILSSHAAIGYFGYQFLLADPAREPAAEVAEVEARSGIDRLDRTANGRPPSAPERSPGGRSEVPGRTGEDPRREMARRAEFAAAFARANHADPSKIDLAEVDRAEAFADSIGEKSAIRGIRNRVAQWEASRVTHDTRLFGTQLASLGRQVDQLEQRTEAGTSVEADAQEVLDLIERISKLGGTFPKHSDEVADQATILSRRAGELLRAITSVERKNGDTPDSMIEESPTQLVPQIAANEDPEHATSRTWTTTSGLSFEASISKLGREQVVFRRTKDGREGEFQVKDLVEEDQHTVLVSYFNEQDDEQLQGTQVYFDQISSTPQDVSDPLKQHHIDFQDSPYGGLWAAVCLSEGENRHSEAARILLQVIKRIEKQQQSDPNRHAMTLASACNNLAVCKIRDYDANAAAVQLVRALKSMPHESPAMIHNALTLQKLGETPAPPWILKGIPKNNLNDALKTHESYRDTLQSGWYYCLNVDLPARSSIGNVGSNNRYLGQPSVTHQPDPMLIPNGWCLACGGMGFQSCDYGNCVKGAITVKKRVQVGTNALTGDPIYGSKNFKERCPNCRGAGGFDCRHCDQGRLP